MSRKFSVQGYMTCVKPAFSNLPPHAPPAQSDYWNSMINLILHNIAYVHQQHKLLKPGWSLWYYCNISFHFNHDHIPGWKNQINQWFKCRSIAQFFLPNTLFKLSHSVSCMSLLWKSYYKESQGNLFLFFFFGLLPLVTHNRRAVLGINIKINEDKTSGVKIVESRLASIIICATSW